mmetsp:Transcript_19947/g.43413  ORF Transcript_19947/g.43413 Transcript_19947/m.43413 type:complete len:275 (-) Transcript_19947:798-1622(-)
MLNVPLPSWYSSVEQPMTFLRALSISQSASALHDFRSSCAPAAWTWPHTTRRGETGLPLAACSRPHQAGFSAASAPGGYGAAAPLGRLFDRAGWQHSHPHLACQAASAAQQPGHTCMPRAAPGCHAHRQLSGPHRLAAAAAGPCYNLRFHMLCAGLCAQIELLHSHPRPACPAALWLHHHGGNHMPCAVVCCLQRRPEHSHQHLACPAAAAPALRCRQKSPCHRPHVRPSRHQCGWSHSCLGLPCPAEAALLRSCTGHMPHAWAYCRSDLLRSH